jgi:hypothetical protein
MKMLSCRPALVLALLFVIVGFTRPASAHAQWQPLESGISVEFHQVTPQVCTWDFQNTYVSLTLLSMKFTVTYPAPAQAGGYNPYNTKTDTDFLPYPLAPKAVVGGWAAFTAPGSCTNVRINVLDRKWDSPM